MRFDELTAQECRVLMTAKADMIINFCQDGSGGNSEMRNAWRATLIKEIAELNDRESAAREGC